MPGRQSHGGPPVRAPKSKPKDKSRSLRALEIASHENPEKFKIRQHRLGASEGGNRPGKRARTKETSDEDEDAGSKPKKLRKNPKGRFDELDVDEGSDSEGNEWKLGQVDSDDDSDLDSDKAFGESDEERFEDFAFGGSSKKGKTSKKGRSTSSSRKGLTLDEDEEVNASNSDSDESLGEDAVDLAQMLDDTDEDMETPGHNESQADSSEDESEDDSDDQSSISSRESSEETDPARLAALRNLIDTLPLASNSSKVSKRNDGVNEFNNPSDFGLISNKKLTLEDLGLTSVQDPHIKKSLKYLESDSKPGKKISGKLDVPLGRREQDRLDRDAAYEKSKETLSRWTDTVQHNRQADHLQFPLPDPDMASAFKNSKLHTAVNSKPFTDLDVTIQNILEESGLATTNGHDDEDKIREFEELEAKKMSLDEVKARRDQLRAARELLFREEAKAKRIKKIKSKSYRRVHRKQREKDERMTREALAEAGVEPSEDEQELQDRRRATERMGARHRSSKWAKATKETGRAAWDEEARAGVSEMARRNEELRKRVEGKTTKRNDEDNSDISASESGEDNSDLDDDQRMIDQLDRLDAADSRAETSGSKLADMQFMKNAEAARKKENDQAIEQLRKELAGEESESTDEEVQNVGRRSFGPRSQGSKVNIAPKPKKQNSFEEPLGSDDEDVMIITQPSTTNPTSYKDKRNPPSKSAKKSGREFQNYTPAETENILEGGAWSRQPTSIEGPRKSKKGVSEPEMEELDLSQAVVMSKPIKASKSKSKKPSMLSVDDEDSGSESENISALPFAIRDQELIKRAFAGADVVGEFEREKRQTIQDEDEKIVDNALPGWGNWVGDGVSKKERNRHKGKFLTKVDGIKADKRKDAKLEKVIINEKRVKKNTKYLASSLPHPFESRQQYERSLRLPVGPEWSTKETFQDSTKPRVILKQGIIAPMSKPLL